MKLRDGVTEERIDAGGKKRCRKEAVVAAKHRREEAATANREREGNRNQSGLKMNHRLNHELSSKIRMGRRRQREIEIVVNGLDTDFVVLDIGGKLAGFLGNGKGKNFP
ncbi:hypothetical protein L2E82_27662 [Cichorium intybus]|uniref:Uncharacterized protein n=1 Tax=Cichorium intybus TaxID=13427 RepID=A0ACB9CTZ3_CICIN|nr:hypothetical protein L2E82_27662 [Cichorium intybus]